MVWRREPNGARASWAMANSMAPLIEVRSANERGDSSRRSPKSFADAPSPTVIQSTTMRCRADPGPLDEGQSDPAIAAGANGVEDPPVGARGGITVALQLGFCGIHATRPL